MGLFDEARRESDAKKQQKIAEEASRKEKATTDLETFRAKYEIEFNRIRQLLSDTAVEINQAGDLATVSEQNKSKLKKELKQFLLDALDGRKS